MLNVNKFKHLKMDDLINIDLKIQEYFSANYIDPSKPQKQMFGDKMRFVTTVSNYEEFFTNKISNDTVKMFKQIDDGRRRKAWLR